MSNMKRLFIVCLSVLMLVSMLVFPASAANDSASATLSSCSVAANLYLDQRVLSAYTRLGEGANYATIDVESWQKHATTGAVVKNATKSASQLYPTYITVSGSPDTGYVLYKAKSTHYVRVGEQHWLCDLGELRA